MYQSAMLRLPAVKQKTGYSRSTIYLRVKQGLLPRPVSIGKKSVGWPGDEVAAVNAMRIAGKSDDDIRALVNEIHNNRQQAA